MPQFEIFASAGFEVESENEEGAREEARYVLLADLVPFDIEVFSLDDDDQDTNPAGGC